MKKIKESSIILAKTKKDGLIIKYMEPLGIASGWLLVIMV